jgi:hypothetical protein
MQAERHSLIEQRNLFDIVEQADQSVTNVSHGIPSGQLRAIVRQWINLRTL